MRPDRIHEGCARAYACAHAYTAIIRQPVTVATTTHPQCTCVVSFNNAHVVAPCSMAVRRRRPITPTPRHWHASNTLRRASIDSQRPVYKHIHAYAQLCACMLFTSGVVSKIKCLIKINYNVNKSMLRWRSGLFATDE